jgi:hypothetical protein
MIRAVHRFTCFVGANLPKLVQKLHVSPFVNPNVQAWRLKRRDITSDLTYILESCEAANAVVLLQLETSACAHSSLGLLDSVVVCSTSHSGDRREVYTSGCGRKLAAVRAKVSSQMRVASNATRPINTVPATPAGKISAKANIINICCAAVMDEVVASRAVHPPQSGRIVRQPSAEAPEAELAEHGAQTLVQT